MLTEIRLLNFKCFADTTLSLLPMTLLAGLNNSGKSTVIQSLRMLWRWVSTGDPALDGHGSLMEMKNKNASRSATMELEYSFRNRDKEKLQITFSDTFEPVIKAFKQSSRQLPLLNYVSADRWGPRVSLPTYTLSDDLIHVGERGEYVIDFLSRHERDIVPEKLIHPKAEGNTLEYNVRTWLEEIAPGIDFKHGTDRKRDTSYAEIDSFRPTNTGFGLSYTLPIIVSLLGMSATWEERENQNRKTACGTIVLVENPEAHLHPKGQTSMGRLIALAATSGVQVVVETHSDHIMDGIRIAVKEGMLKANETIFHYFQKEKEYECSVTSPKLYPDGKLEYWPVGFFDQTMKNRARLARRD